MDIPNQYIKNLYRVGLVLLAILSLYYGVKSLSEFRYYRNNAGYYSIAVSGHGEVTAVPDIANVYFSIRKDAKTVKEAQDAVATVEKSALELLRENKIEDKDIKTTGASFNPKYEYKYDTKTSMPCYEWGCPSPSGRSVIVGYEASESITVKVRNADDVGKIMQGLGTLGVTDLNGPDFSIDNEDDLKAEARKLAIDNAKAKAEILAKDLDVKLGKMVSFSDSEDYYSPMYYGKAEMSYDAGMPAPAEIPKGENTISADVTITYEIR